MADIDYEARVIRQLGIVPSGWARVESVAYGIRTSVATVRPVLEKLVADKKIQTRLRGNVREWALCS